MATNDSTTKVSTDGITQGDVETTIATLELAREKNLLGVRDKQFELIIDRLSNYKQSVKWHNSTLKPADKIDSDQYASLVTDDGE